MTTSNISTLSSWDTEYSADSVEWCPHEPNLNVFVCGTYQLSEEDEKLPSGTSNRTRVGRILLFSIITEGKLQLHQTIETAAVLDQKWCHNLIDGSSFLGIVNADGKLQVYELTSEIEPQLSLVIEVEINAEADGNLGLSLDWSTGKYNSKAPYITVSDSNGAISLWKFGNRNIEGQQHWSAHEFEAWITAFDYWHTDVIYTGGDDCKFLTFDLRIGNIPKTTSRAHSAGVTSLHSNSKVEYLLASGSYDEHLLLWDTRNHRNPISKSNLNGGIWRLKWDPFDFSHLLAACMYGAFNIVSCKNSESPIIVAEYHEHESISYGSDWCYLENSKVQNLLNYNHNERNDNIVRILGTCSFYDHKLNVTKLMI